jgi:hypothetical protein
MVADFTPLVSVVVPTYDWPEKLRAAVESVAAQTYPNIELVVVDDCSPTLARSVLASAAPESLSYTCIRHDENRRANAARNTGIRATDGDIVSFLDDDDRWDPAKTTVEVEAFASATTSVSFSTANRCSTRANSRTSEPQKYRVTRRSASSEGRRARRSLVSPSGARLSRTRVSPTSDCSTRRFGAAARRSGPHTSSVSGFGDTATELVAFLPSSVGRPARRIRRV